ncbi:MAG TPA: sugar transferase [Longimicrobiaceae bacterium]|nr:sugar transferase [Longimicrobiaceae bacterium]
MSSSVAVEGASLPAQSPSLFRPASGGSTVSPLSSVALPPPGNALQTELLQALDTAGALALLFAVWLGLNLHRMPEGVEGFLTQRVTMKNALLAGGFMLLWPRLISLFGLYDPRPLPRRDKVLRVFLACTVGSALAFVFPLTSISGSFRWVSVLYFWVGSVALTLAVRVPVRSLNATSLVRTPRRVLLVGSGPRALRVAREIQARPEKDLELIGFVDSNDHPLSKRMGVPKLGTLEELEDLLMHHVVDEVLIALPIKSRYAQIQHVIRMSERTGTESKFLADIFECSVARPRYEHGDQFPIVANKVFYDDYRVVVKRLLDLVLASVALVALAPLLALIALAIKLTSPGPVIFAQERYGLNKRRFRMYKFRTMVHDAEALQPALEARNEAVGPAFKIRNDPRVTRVGRILRRTSFDELPQLVNVLLGQMSLVGPRPMAVRDVQLFDQAWFMRRFSAPPGMTGLWQVSGRSNLGFDDWVTLDLKYIDEWSLALDARILAKTLPAVVRGVGAV